MRPRDFRDVCLDGLDALTDSSTPSMPVNTVKPVKSVNACMRENTVQALIVGIDPGAKTGYAEWDAQPKRFCAVDTLKAWDAIRRVQALRAGGQLRMVVLEDARLRRWFGDADRRATRGPGVREGAGAIKRECTLWVEMLGDLGIPYRSVKPSAGATKWTAEQFAKVTGWTSRTSEHARDAALLVWGMSCAAATQPASCSNGKRTNGGS